MRFVVCSSCGNSRSSGTSQVYRKLLFHFCALCWRTRRLDCHQLMLASSAEQVAKTVCQQRAA